MQTNKNIPLSALALSCALLFPSLAVGQAATDVACNRCVDTGDMAPGAITNGKLQDGAVTSAKIKDGAVGKTDIAAGAISRGKLENGAVDSSKIKNGSLRTEDFKDGAVTVDKLDASARVIFAGNTGGSTTFLVNAGCVNNAHVTISVPGPGRIKVDAQAWLRLTPHTSGTNDRLHVYIGAAADECTESSAAEAYQHAAWQIGSDVVTFAQPAFVTVPVSRTFTIVGGGEYTFYLNGTREEGTGVMNINASAMQAVFYPGAD